MSVKVTSFSIARKEVFFLLCKSQLGRAGLSSILAFAKNGTPLVNNENHEGYTGLAKNSDGPLRVVVEGFQGGSIKACNKIVVTLSGEGSLSVK